MPLRAILALSLLVSVSTAHAETQRLSGKILLAEVSNNRLLISSASEEAPALQVRYTHATNFTNIVSVDQLQIGEEVQIEGTQVEPNVWKASSIRLSSAAAAPQAAPVPQPEPAVVREPEPAVVREPEPAPEPEAKFEAPPAPAPAPAPAPERRGSEPRMNFLPKTAEIEDKPEYREKIDAPQPPPVRTRPPQTAGSDDPDRSFLDKLANRIERLHDDVIRIGRDAMGGVQKRDRNVDRHYDARDASSRVRSRSDLR